MSEATKAALAPDLSFPSERFRELLEAKNQLKEQIKGDRDQASKMAHIAQENSEAIKSEGKNPATMISDCETEREKCCQMLQALKDDIRHLFEVELTRYRNLRQLLWTECYVAVIEPRERRLAAAKAALVGILAELRNIIAEAPTEHVKIAAAVEKIKTLDAGSTAFNALAREHDISVNAEIPEGEKLPATVTVDVEKEIREAEGLWKKIKKAFKAR